MEPPLRLCLCCTQPTDLARLKSDLALAEGVEIVATADAAPGVWLCAAYTCRDAANLIEQLPSPHAPVVMLDLSGCIGAEVAALHGYSGYLWLAVPWERQRMCLANAALGRLDAPDPHAATFHDAWRRGPLEGEERQILRQYARSATREQTSRALGIPEATLERRVASLRRRLRLDLRESLGIRAERLGFGP